MNSHTHKYQYLKLAVLDPWIILWEIQTKTTPYFTLSKKKVMKEIPLVRIGATRRTGV